jgi:hypothetical protein
MRNEVPFSGASPWLPMHPWGMAIPVLAEALKPVLRDLKSTGAPLPEVREEDWAADPAREVAYLVSQDGSMSGIAVELNAAEVDRTVWVTDQVQDWVIEELQGTTTTNWPPCPNHPETHPLRCAARGADARWVCPHDGTTFQHVGLLS